MGAAQIVASNFIVENGISKLPLEFSDLEKLCDELNLYLFTYSDGIELINKYNLQKHTKHKAFTHSVDNMCTIFYEDNLSMSDKLFCVSHELGHITLAHSHFNGIVGTSNKTKLSQVQENEANEFAYCILAPLPVLNACNVNTFKDICDITMLDEEKAAYILRNLEDFRPSPRDAKVLEVYDELIKDYNRAKDKYIKASLAEAKTAELKQKDNKSHVKQVDKITRKLRKASRDVLRKPITAINFFAVVLFLGFWSVFLNSTFDLPTTPQSPPSPIVQTVDPTFPSNSIVATIAPNISNSEAPMVYVTPSGHKYHLTGCYHTRGSQLQELTIAEAEEQGLQGLPSRLLQIA